MMQKIFGIDKWLFCGRYIDAGRRSVVHEQGMVSFAREQRFVIPKPFSANV